jgi:hypothetical protein
MPINYEALTMVHPGLGTSVQGFLPTTARVFRQATAPAQQPVTDLDFGYGNTTASIYGGAQPDETEIATLRCSLTENRTGDGKQTVIVDKVEVVVPYRVTFAAKIGANLIHAGDRLLIGEMSLKVIIPPRPGSFEVFASAICQEIQ